MKIKKLTFSNFKFVDSSTSYELNIPNCTSLVMGGANGYGKSTVFDAIELLITGEIKHFNPKLLNRGESNYAELANDPNYDIEIRAELMSDNKIITLERLFNSNDNFSSTLKYDNKIITTEDLFKKININKSFFNLGIYISQIDSLNFLQQKYKNRKSEVSSLIDNSEIHHKIQIIENIRTNFDDIYKKARDIEKNLYNEREARIKLLQDKIRCLNLSKCNFTYSKLFPDQENLFDNLHFTSLTDYETSIKEIDKLSEFIIKLPTIRNIQFNNSIDKILEINKNIYYCLFYIKEISECKRNEQLLFDANLLLNCKSDFQSNKYHFNDNIKSILGINDDISILIEKHIDADIILNSKLSRQQVSLNQLLEYRSSLITVFKSNSNNNSIATESCPLCGRYSDKLQVLFDETEATLKENLSSFYNDIKENNDTLYLLYTSHIIPKINHFIAQNSRIISNNELLNPYKNITTNELNEMLDSLDIIFINDTSTVDIEIFSEKYDNLIKNIEQKKMIIDEPLSQLAFNEYKQLKTKYYPTKKYHTIEELTYKKNYLTHYFANDAYIELDNLQTLHANHKRKINKLESLYDTKRALLTLLLQKYKESYKQYELIIAKNIEIPMYVFSGKIIQNFPLGLGIHIAASKTSLEFVTENSSVDIFNSLSAGQLNGVIISFLLAVKEVFAADSSLDILLIDDPLQTIDDISAISLVDLLSGHFRDTQIILSTHEYDKQFLIQLKYEQSGSKCRVIDMQEEYYSIS